MYILKTEKLTVKVVMRWNVLRSEWKCDNQLMLGEIVTET